MTKSSEVILEAVAPHYWEQACKELMKNDRIMRKLIPKFGTGFLMTRGDPFVTLARSIVGQQISVSAAQAVWDRVVIAAKNNREIIEYKKGNSLFPFIFYQFPSNSS